MVFDYFENTVKETVIFREIRFYSVWIWKLLSIMYSMYQLGTVYHGTTTVLFVFITKRSKDNPQVQNKVKRNAE